MNTHIYSDAKDIFPCFVFPVPTLNRLYTNIIFPFDISPFSKLVQVFVRAMRFFFPAVTDKRPFPIQFSFSPLAQQGRIYPHILFESGLCARTQTQTRWAGLGQSFFYFTEKKKRKRKKTCDDERVPASSLSRSSSARVCCSSSISFSIQSLKKKKKL